jgi:hypothetical protein
MYDPTAVVAAATADLTRAVVRAVGQAYGRKRDDDNVLLTFAPLAAATRAQWCGILGFLNDCSLTRGRVRDVAAALVTAPTTAALPVMIHNVIVSDEILSTRDLLERVRAWLGEI